MSTWGFDTEGESITRANRNEDRNRGETYFDGEAKSIGSMGRVYMEHDADEGELSDL